MSKFIFAAIFILITFLVIEGILLSSKIIKAKDLVATAKPFRVGGSRYDKTMLVLGDSTGVGVGAADPEDSVAGRLAHFVGATYVENVASSGAVTRDLRSQISSANLEFYDLILVQIGGNDIIRLHDPSIVGNELAGILHALPKHRTLIVISAGNVGGTTFFPFFLNPLYTRFTLMYHKVFNDIVFKNGGSYVNLYIEPDADPFLLEPKIYLAADGLHPSSEGYRLWFEKIKSSEGLEK